MKKNAFFLFFLLFWTGSMLAQAVGINTDGSIPDPSSILDVKATNKGMLVPRVTTLQRNSIVAPATGLLVYDMETTTFWFYNGVAWISLLVAETDPQVGSSTANRVPKWDGMTLTDGVIYDDGIQIGIGTAAPANRLSVSGNADVSGNVGIGISAPQEKLEVDGIVKANRFRMTQGNPNDGYVLRSDGSGLGNWVDPNSLSITENDPKVGYLDNNYMPRWNGTQLVNGVVYHSDQNNIGIGNVSPTNRLSVSGSADFSNNVGIGVAAPQERLEVDGTAKVNRLLMTQGNPANGYVLRSDAGGLGSWVDPATLNLTSNISANKVPRSNGTSLVQGSIYDDGNVGIGVTSPQEKLEVDGVIKANRLLMTQGNPTNGYVLRSDAGGLGTWVDPGTLTLATQIPTNAVPKSNGSDLVQGSIFDNGNVGIGIASPQEKLEVDGIVKANRFWMTQGGPANGYLLRSDATGVGSWSDPSALFTSGTGINITGTSITNTAPDQTVTLTGSGSTTVSGTYPNFTVSSTDNNTTYSSGTGIDITGTTISNTAPDQTVTLTGSGATTITGTYPNFTVSSPVADASYWSASGGDIYKNNTGGVGIGTSDPLGLIHVSGGNFLNTGTYGSGAALSINGAGTRMFFYPKKAAFRAGSTDDAEWDDLNIGDYSAVLGNSNQATGESSFAAGNYNIASGFGATALGSDCEGTGDNTFVAGNNNTATGRNAAALGTLNTASGESALALGAQNTASGYASTALGSVTIASGVSSTALGFGTVASGHSSTALGFQAAASGNNAVAIGTGTTAPSGSEISVGSYNTAYTPLASNGWDASDRIFTVGNGDAIFNRSDAMVILKNGNVGIGTSLPANKMEVNGTFKTVGFQMPTGAVDGYVLQSDADGNASWAAASATENDPKIGTLTTNYVPKWDGNTLTNSSLYDNNNIVSIGTANPDYGENFQYAKLAIMSEDNDVTDFNNILANESDFSPWINWGKARGTAASPAAVQNGDQLFLLTINGHDGTSYQESANLEVVVDDTPTEGSVPSRMTFSTTETGEDNPTERMRINHQGHVGIGTNHPVNRLHVENSTPQSNTIYGHYSGNSSGTNWAGSNNYSGVSGVTSTEENASFQAGVYGYVAGNGLNTGGVVGAWDEVNWAGLGYNDENGETWGLYCAGRTSLNGGLYIRNGSQSEGYILQSDADGMANWVDPGEILTETDPEVGDLSEHAVPRWDGSTLTDGTIVDDGSNVGIGTSSPSTKLHIRGGSDASLTSTSGYLAMGDVNSQNLVLDDNEIMSRNNGATSALYVQNDGGDLIVHNAQGGNTQFSVLNTGKVGIGTTAPGNNLDIQASTSATASVQSSASTAYIKAVAPSTNEAALNFSTYSSGSTQTRWLIGKSNTSESGSNAGSNLFINRYSDAGAYISQPFKINRSTGYVGIGLTTNPTVQLDVSGDIHATDGEIKVVDDEQALALRANATGNYVQIDVGGTGHSTDDIYIGDLTNAANKVIMMGSAGIGTTSPTQAKLVVNGSASNTLSYGYLNSAGSTSTSTGTNTYSIYASARIAATEFNAFSDARIKNIQGISDSRADLQTLLGIEITNYQLKDHIAKGNTRYKKVIAQQVEKVYPQAVSTITDAVPDIYQLADIQNGRIALANTLKAGDRVKLIFGERTETVVVTAADTTGFQVGLRDQGQVFVYGREVSDFRTVDYEALSMLNISATQELVKTITRQNEAINALKADNESIKAANASMQNDIQLIKAALQLNATTTEK